MDSMRSDGGRATHLIQHIHYVGSYPPTYARHRIIQSGLRELDIDVDETVDRSLIPFRWWRLASQLQQLPRDGVIIFGEAGSFMFPVLLRARQLGLPLVFDPFVSLRMAAEDKQAGWRKTVLAPLGETIDRINDWAAGALLFDTPQTLAYFVENLGLAPEKGFVAYVGAELELFNRTSYFPREQGPYRVLFYGSFIPLHGIDVIIRAAARVQRATDSIQFQIVGSGQTRREVQELAQKLGLKNVIFGPARVSYFDLPSLICTADLCLGIFADRPKTKMVIPHKLYQCAAMSAPVITADTPAIRSAFDQHELALVPAGDPEALADAVLDLLANPDRRAKIAGAGSEAIRTRFSPRVIASQVLRACHAVSS